MALIPFSEKELETNGFHMKLNSSPRPATPRYNTPITPAENFLRALRRDGTALWFPMVSDGLNVESRTNTDHIARAEIYDMGPVQPLEEKGGPDLFGIEWDFVPMVGGSMVRPGNPALEDANDWREVIRFPDVDALDWEGCKINAVLNGTEKLLGVTFQNGMFERLISFMGFEGAAMALVDEDQQDAVHELFDALADMYIRMIDKYCEILNVQSVTFHDDWGSQRAPFFSPEICREMIVPHIKKISDYCHSRNIMFNHHSCGFNQMLVPEMIAEGDDLWYPQAMNDMDYLVNTYGDRLVIGVTPPPVAEDSTDEEIEAAARSFVAKYAPSFKEKPIVVFAMMAPLRYTEAIYRESRIALCGKE